MGQKHPLAVIKLCFFLTFCFILPAFYQEISSVFILKICQKKFQDVNVAFGRELRCCLKNE